MAEAIAHDFENELHTAGNTKRARKPTDHYMAIPDGTGDTKTIWDKNVPEEVDNARTQFESFIKKGYWAFKTNAAGEKAERVTTFDPQAERIIFAKQLVGG